MEHRLQTLGHATLVVTEDGRPILATDPWLIGSVYWRSWWLEKYPTKAEIDLVRSAEALYVTHTHPDHFHLPSLRRLGQGRALVARFPRDTMSPGLRAEGFAVEILEPWRWYALSPAVQVASIPVPIDDSLLIVDTPHAVIVNLNDAMPVRGLLELIRDRVLPPGKARIMLKSYAPASVAFSIFRGGLRQPMKEKRDYAATVQSMAEALGATHYIPFASQAFFSRIDSRWANEYKVVYEDLLQEWKSPTVLCKPFVSMDLGTLEYRSGYGDVVRELDAKGAAKVQEQETDEALFVAPPDFDAQLKRYLDEVRFLRLFFRRGIGFRLTTSGTERYYRSAKRAIERRIPEDYDIVIEVPDKVVNDALDRNVMTDLGITMIIRVHSRVPSKVAYGAFLLMGLHDNGHFTSLRSVARFTSYYLPYFLPWLWRLGRFPGTRASDPTHARTLRSRARADADLTRLQHGAATSHD